MKVIGVNVLTDMSHPARLCLSDRHDGPIITVREVIALTGNQSNFAFRVLLWSTVPGKSKVGGWNDVGHVVGVEFRVGSPRIRK